MDKLLEDLLPKPLPETADEIELAMRELFQSLTLLGLWRSKFFEKAAFYGGTSLRILYGLNRFSEDLDFSLLSKDNNFNLRHYGNAVINEFKVYGFDVSFEIKEKSQNSSVESAFLKGNTLTQFIVIDAPAKLLSSLNRNSLIKIKIEIDTNPPQDFSTEMKYVFSPIQFAVRSYTLPSLFAGKLHALLFRKWANRVKGRDWYDFIWYCSNYSSLDLNHLEARMRQSGDYNFTQKLTMDYLKELLNSCIDDLVIQNAKKEVERFLKKSSELELWSKEFFKAAVERIIAI